MVMSELAVLRRPSICSVVELGSRNASPDEATDRMIRHRTPNMPRPTLLVAEPEPDQALSVRKLVLETAKFNVLTAHSTREAIDLLHLFPNISLAVLVDSDGIDCEWVTNAIRGATNKIPVIFLSPRIGARCKNADHKVSSHQPEDLLTLVRSLLGDPRTQDEAPKSQQ